MTFMCKQKKLRTPLLKAALSALVLGTACLASVNVTLTPSVGSGAPVGTTVLWTAHASDTTNSNATFVYQFSFGLSGGQLQIRRDFYAYSNFPWTPTDSEGTYNAQVIVRSSTGASGMAMEVFNVSSRITGSSPVVSGTNNSLVALYSMPACPTGQSARVRFKGPGDPIWQLTQIKSCTGSTSLNFYVAGMRASTTYEIQHDVLNGPFTTSGPIFNFTTGAIPGNVSIAPYSVTQGYAAPNNTAYPIVLLGLVGSTPYATGTGGHVVWYLTPPGVPIGFFVRPVEGGTFFAFCYDGFSVPTDRLFREYDMAGNIVRETNTAIVSEQLKARGADPVTTFHHDAIRLPNGGTALFGSVEKVADQGQGPVDVLGDQVIVLDANMQVVWSWNEFDHLDIKRPAVMNEKCFQNGAGCPYLFNPGYTVANDWTHSNGLTLTPDGNMLVSSRHQDWIMKIRYQNGTGDGTLLWKLGADGNFTTDSTVPSPWFSHQHNPEVTPDGRLTVFDNGNTRIANNNNSGDSRGQAWYLDQAHMVAHLVYNVDLGAFSVATGSAQALSNGNYTFNLGFVGTNSYTKEYTSSGTEGNAATGVVVSDQSSGKNSYRSFRMRSLFVQY